MLFSIPMKRTDARKLSHEKLTELRQRAIAAVQAGESPQAVARVMGVHCVTVYNWLALYRQGGWNRLNARKRGGRKPKLDGMAMAWVYGVVTLGNPQQMKFPFVLWSAKLLAGVIAKELGIRLSKASVCRLLHQLGLSPQRPLWRAYQRDPKAVERWMETEFPAIKMAARKAKGDIWFGDEAGVRSDAHSGTTWAPVGQTPVVSTTGARFGMNLISAVNRRGQMRFICVNGRVNADVFIVFLKRLLATTTRCVFLVVDGHPTHKAVKTRKFVESTKGRLHLFFLPGYSPDLNPDELVWNNLKNHTIGKCGITGPDQMKKLVIGHMRSIQKQRNLVRAFFQAPSTKYAA
jgi:transposase